MTDADAARRAVAAALASAGRLPRGPARLHLVAVPYAEASLHAWIAFNPRTRRIVAHCVAPKDADGAESAIGRLYAREALFLDGAVRFHGADRQIQGVDVDYAQLLEVYGPRDHTAAAVTRERLAELEAALAAACKEGKT